MKRKYCYLLDIYNNTIVIYIFSLMDDGHEKGTAVMEKDVLRINTNTVFFKKGQVVHNTVRPFYDDLNSAVREIIRSIFQ